MASGRMREVMRRLGQMTLVTGALSDAELLQRYISRRDEAAFAALVRRHGPMVLGVCRRVLRHPHDADDAFQATFLVLVRKAQAIVPPERVGAWLYGVAYRTSIKAKAMNLRRRARQRPLEDVPGPAESADAEWLALLDREINRLPEKYRLPIVLCDLEGKTRRQAARALRWPEGTIATRLQHGRALVQKRLARHGLTASAGAITLTWAHDVSAAPVSPSLAASTVKTASLLAGGKMAGLIPLKIIALAEGVLQAMVFNKLKTLSAALVLVGVLGLGLSGLVGTSRSAAAAPPAADKPTPPRVNQTPTIQGSVEKNDGRLPIGPVPVQALVSLDKDKVVVKTNQPVYQPKQGVDEAGRQVTFYEVVYTLRADRYGREEVEVYDMRRNKLDTNDLAKLLNKEIAALVLAGTREIDPLHLRLIKEGTLIFVLPLRGIPAPAAVPGTPAVAPPSPPAFAPPPSRAALPNGAAPPLPPAPQASPPHSPRPLDDVRSDEGERQLAIAQFYLRTGRPGSAAFYCELIRQRYPGTMFADEAGRLLETLGRDTNMRKPEKVNARVGEIHIVGNEKVPDTVILENLPFHPGQVLNFHDLRAGAEKLGRLKQFVNDPALDIRPRVTVLASPGEYKPILVNVSESQPQATGAPIIDVIEEIRDRQGGYLKYYAVTVTSMTTEKRDEKTYATGPGEIFMLSANNGDAGPLASGAAPAPKQGAGPNTEKMKLTHIYYDGRVFNNNKEKISRVYDNVRVLHFPANKPNATMNPDRPPKDGFFLKCEELTIYTRELGPGRTSRILNARKRVEFTTDTFFGRADSVTWDENSDQVIFEGAPAMVYKTVARPEEIKAKKIMYNRKTGTFVVHGATIIQSRLAPHSEERLEACWRSPFATRLGVFW